MKLLKSIFHALRTFNFGVLIFTALILLPQSGFTSDRFSAGLNFDTFTPKGELKDNLNRNGYGISGMGLVKPNLQVPLKIGFELGYINYGTESRSEQFSSTIPDVMVRVRRYNNIFLSHLVLRAQKDMGIFSPYVDGLFGLTYLWTNTSVEGEDTSIQFASSNNSSDSALSYGFGGGIMCNVWSGTNQTTDDVKVYIDLKIRYLYGGEAEYLKKGAISIDDNNNVANDIIESETDMMLYKIGLAISF
ncbi:hypothetical protein ACFL2X_06360 [Candidatus Latescibacterota bacterium]